MGCRDELGLLRPRDVDRLARDAEGVPGGLFVLGSVHADMVALLEDRQAPLYHRLTDHIEVGHLDIASILAILRAHGAPEPEHLLFLWNLFEGVPKFYRDCYEQGVLSASRTDLLATMFFRSSSPLRTEADTWFLSELRGRYDVVLKYIARHPGCTHADLLAHIRNLSADAAEQVGGYVKLLIERYQMIERRQPIFAEPNARQGRYYIRDNFLRAWLGCLANPIAAINFRPEGQLIEQADQRLHESEGFGLERLVGVLYEERSRKGTGDFPLTRRVEGYWNRAGTEIDLIVLNEDEQRIRFGTYKRSEAKLTRGHLQSFDGHIQRFLEAHRLYQTWTIERVAVAPELTPSVRAALGEVGYLGQDLADLTAEL